MVHRVAALGSIRHSGQARKSEKLQMSDFKKMAEIQLLLICALPDQDMRLKAMEEFLTYWEIKVK
jgi:hypothetical protein